MGPRCCFPRELGGVVGWGNGGGARGELLDASSCNLGDFGVGDLDLPPSPVLVVFLDLSEGAANEAAEWFE